MARNFACGHRPDNCEVSPVKIEIQNLVVEHPGGIRALDGIDCMFNSEKAVSYALLGANGAGKSTLLEAILGLATIDSGQILVNGVKVEKHSLGKIRGQIGLVFQNPDDQLFSQTVREDIAFGAVNLRLSPEEVERRVTEAMERMNIASLAERDVSRLSGGEKRRVALAGILAMHSEAILFDEPTSMLDPRGSRELADHLKKLPALKICATHDLTFVERTCDICIVLKDGKVAAQDTCSRILSDRALLESCGLL